MFEKPMGEVEISPAEQVRLSENLEELGENLGELEKAVEGKKLGPEFEATLKTLKDFWDRNHYAFEFIALMTVVPSVGEVVLRHGQITELIEGLKWFAGASTFAGSFMMPRVVRELIANLKGLKKAEA